MPTQTPDASGAFDDLTAPRSLFLAVLVVAFVARTFIYGSVFRPHAVVLLATDPYRYRTTLETLTAAASGPLDPTLFMDPGRDDLMLATMGVIAELLGGGVTVVGWLLAWYPVLVGLATCGIAYAVGTRLSGSRSVGVLAAGMLAITPGYVLRTALGFGDHHAFDYLWLAVTTLAVVSVVSGRPSRTRRDGAAVVALAVALASQVLAWRGGLLLVVPFAAIAVLHPLSALRADRSPVAVGGPLVVALGLASFITLAAVEVLEWQSPAVAAVLGSMTAVGVVVVGIGSARFRGGWGPAVGGVVAVAGLAVLAALARSVGPEVFELVGTGTGYFQRSTTTVAEASSLFSGGAVGGPMLTLGPLFLLAIPYLLVLTAGVFTEHRPGWLVIVVYCWYFLGLSAVQRRFVGELALFFGIVVAVGVVDVSSRLGLLRGRPTLERLLEGSAPRMLEMDAGAPRRTVVVTAVALVLVVAVSVVGISGALDRNAYEEAEYETARWMGGYVEQHGLPVEDAYVFSSHRTNPMYNYFARGDAGRFGYARDNYVSFLLSTDDETWSERLRSRGTRLVVVERGSGAAPGESMQSSLHAQFGDGYGSSTGTNRFRALYRSDDGSVAVFRPVRGAFVTGTATPNATVPVRTNVAIPGGTFTYVRQASTTMDGHFAVRVPYPGTYTGGRYDVTVTGTEVQRGLFGAERTDQALWSFGEGRGDVAFDSRGANHGFVRGATWGDGVLGRGLVLEGDGYVEVPNASRLDGSGGFTLSVWFRTDPVQDYVNGTPYPRLVTNAPRSTYRGTSGYQIALAGGRALGGIGDGDDVTVLHGRRVDDAAWHRVTLTWDGTTARLFVDGRLEEEGRQVSRPSRQRSVVVGATADGGYGFEGTIDEVRYWGEAVPPPAVRASYNRTTVPGETP